MKSTFITLAALLGMSAHAFAADEVKVLDLSKAETEMTFDAATGAWTGTYNDDEYTIDSQCFSMLHNSMSDYNTWWGFTASNSTDNTRKEDTVTYQFSNMAKGGIVLNEDGTVKTDSYGAPVTDASMPYLVGFAMDAFGPKTTGILINDGNAYEAVGVYVNLTSWPYYSIEYGDNFCRAFTNGDNFTLTILGVAPDGTEKTVDVRLAEYSNGNLTINRGWRYVDLSELGVVDEYYFSLTSTDSGVYGMNTPAYFCLDKLTVRPKTVSAISSIEADGCDISYSRATSTVNLTGADYAGVYDSTGRLVKSGEGSFSIADLPHGVYVVKAHNKSLKVIR